MSTASSIMLERNTRSVYKYYVIIQLFLPVSRKKEQQLISFCDNQPAFYLPFFNSNLYPMPQTVEIAHDPFSGSFSRSRLICTSTVRVSPRYS